MDAARQHAVDHRGDLADFVHHALELIGIDRLWSVGERLVGLMMYFDQDAVGAHRDRRPRHGQHLVALAGAVAGIDEDGQVAQLLHGGNNAQIESVAGVVGKGSHAALAQNHLVIALAHDVLGGHQELVEGSAHAALQQHRLPQPPGMLQQRKILHVARADLDHVGPLGDQAQGFVVDGFGDDPQAEFVPDFGHDLQRFKAQALECIGRSARLVSAAAEELRAGCGHLLGDSERLLAALDRAGAGDDGQ